MKLFCKNKNKENAKLKGKIYLNLKNTLLAQTPSNGQVDITYELCMFEKTFLKLILQKTKIILIKIDFEVK